MIESFKRSYCNWDSMHIETSVFNARRAGNSFLYCIWPMHHLFDIWKLFVHEANRRTINFCLRRKVLNQLPREWAFQLLDVVAQPESDFCVTRRSAGIPYLLTAILVSQPKEERFELLHTVGPRLIEIGAQTGANVEFVDKSKVRLRSQLGGPLALRPVRWHYRSFSFLSRFLYS